MAVYSASFWEDYDTYAYKKARKEVSKNRKKSKKEKKREMKLRNSKTKAVAKGFLTEMKNNPSELEKKMITFLDSHGVRYEFQRIFYIKDGNNNIDHFYIADFFIPDKSIIIEMDGAFHDNQIREDIIRTREIKNSYPGIRMLRYRWNDMNSYIKMKDLLLRLKD